MCLEMHSNSGHVNAQNLNCIFTYLYSEHYCFFNFAFPFLFADIAIFIYTC